MPVQETDSDPSKPEHDFFKVVNFGDDYDRHWNEPAPAPIVEGLLYSGDVSQLAGQSKQKKTWLAIQLAWCVAAGRPFLGHKTTQGRVLYVNYELKPQSMRKRQARVASGLGLANEETQNDEWFPGAPFVGSENFDSVPMRGKRIKFSDVRDAAIAKIRAAIKEGQPYTLVIFDPLYRTLSGGDSERSDSVMAEVLSSMAEIAECGPAVLFVHHYPKGNRTEMSALDRAGGSAVIGRFIDSNFAMDKNRAKGCTTISPDIRDGVTPEKFVVRFTEKFVFERAEEVNPNRLDRQNGGHGKTPEDLVKLMPEDMPLKAGKIHTLACGPLGLESTQVDKLRNEAVSRKLLTKLEAGPLYVRPKAAPAPRS